MISAKSYAKAYLVVTASLDALERIAWLMVMADRRIQRQLRRILETRSQGVLEPLKIPSPIVRFLRVLAEDRGLHRLDTIAAQGLRLIVDQELGTPVQLISARTLSPSVIEHLVEQLTAQSIQPVVMTHETDPRVLGGVRLQVGQRQIDQTLKSRVSGLAHALSAQ